jgi:hypothetical protein
VVADLRGRVDRRLDDRLHPLRSPLAPGEPPALAAQHVAEALDLAAVPDHLHLSHDESGHGKCEQHGENDDRLEHE